MAQRPKGMRAKEQSRKAAKKVPITGNRPEQPAANGTFPIVGVGASAGGLEAFTSLLKALPGNTGMAFVLVQHMDPSHESALSKILSRATEIPVNELTDSDAVEPHR